MEASQAVTGCLTEPLGNGVLEEVRVSFCCLRIRHSEAAAIIREVVHSLHLCPHALFTEDPLSSLCGEGN